MHFLSRLNSYVMLFNLQYTQPGLVYSSVRFATPNSLHRLRQQLYCSETFESFTLLEILYMKPIEFFLQWSHSKSRYFWSTTIKSIVLRKKIYITWLLAVDTISCFLHVKSFATSCVLDIVKHFQQDAREVHVRHVQNEQRSVQKVLHVTQRPNLRSKILHRQCLPKMVYFSSTQSVENIYLY